MGQWIKIILIALLIVLGVALVSFLLPILAIIGAVAVVYIALKLATFVDSDEEDDNKKDPPTT